MIAEMRSAAQVKTFALAGRAILTIRSRKTQDRFTYRLKRSDDGKVHFVSVLCGPDNTNQYRYFGVVKDGGRFIPSRKRVIPQSKSKSVAGFEWFWNAIRNDHLPETVEVWHEGRCGRCGRLLTVPESIKSGFGPECSQYVCVKV